jgi:hypothetical protein
MIICRTICMSWLHNASPACLPKVIKLVAIKARLEHNPCALKGVHAELHGTLRLTQLLHRTILLYQGPLHFMSLTGKAYLYSNSIVTQNTNNPRTLMHELGQ